MSSHGPSSETDPDEIGAALKQQIAKARAVVDDAREKLTRPPEDRAIERPVAPGGKSRARN